MPIHKACNIKPGSLKGNQILGGCRMSLVLHPVTVARYAKLGELVYAVAKHCRPGS